MDGTIARLCYEMSAVVECASVSLKMKKAQTHETVQGVQKASTSYQCVCHKDCGNSSRFICQSRTCGCSRS